MKEDLKKRNKIMISIIAIATLLVAVVGATFAYFSANQSNNGNVSVTATTSTRDLIQATGSGTLSITTDNELMAQPNANDNTAAYSQSDSNLSIAITAGTGTATCTYDLYYVASAANTVFPGTAAAISANKNELTISGTSTSGNTLAEKDIHDCGTSGCKLNTTAFTSSGTTTTATDVWTLTLKFYNLSLNQDEISGQTFSGHVEIRDLVCTNNSVNNTNPESVQTTESIIQPGEINEPGQNGSSLNSLKVLSTPGEPTATVSNIHVGDRVGIGTEQFYVIGKSGNNVKLLSRYNLNVGELVNPNGVEGKQYFGLGITRTNVNDYNSYVEYLDGVAATYYGVVPFADEIYWCDSEFYDNYGACTISSQYLSNKFVYNSQASIKTYVDDYVDTLTEMGLNVTSGSLLSKSELESVCNASIDFSEDVSTYTNDNCPNYISETSYWLGFVSGGVNPATFEDDPYNPNADVHSIDPFGFFYNDVSDVSANGVRPVINITLN